MSKLFRPKTMRRMVVFLAMVAPAVYLFGSLFSALSGAHGTQVFADGISEQTVDYPVTMMRGKWLDADGTVYDVSWTWLSEKIDIYPTGGVYTFDYPVTDVVNTLYGYYSGDTFVSRGVFSSNTGSYSFELPDGIDGIRLGLSFSNSPNTLSVSLTGHFTDMGTYFDAVGNSNYIFGQFFDKDNFLVKWGENAISENPFGFAPFGYFWRYLDVNVLHLSNDQVGLMAYGYMYYASHVLLFDVGFILVTFFLTFIQKVADKIGGEDHA